MSKSDGLVENVNKVIYTELEKVLRTINKRYYFSMYMVFLEKGVTYKEVKRIKKTVSGNNTEKFEVMQESLQDIQSVLSELNLLTELHNIQAIKFEDELKRSIDQQLYRVPVFDQMDLVIPLANVEMQMFQPSTNEMDRIPDTRNLYSNKFDIRIGRSQHTLVYILEIVNLDKNTQSLFYNEPQLSFLRMVLDYFFLDYFTDLDSLEVFLGSGINKKYNEDSVQFIRRVTRLFFGKIHSFISDSGAQEKDVINKFINRIANEYYISNLMENMDDISTHTYEGSSPFGSILFIDQRISSKGLDLIKFAIKFKDEDRIQLNDSKRIRKLLELTNDEKDLYLIADHQSIYGLGEVKWGQLGDNQLFRLDFKGLSKYNFVLVGTEDQTPQNIGTIVQHADQKTYQVTRDIKIQDKNLVSVSFKTPSIGETGYILEKFKNMLSHQFYDKKVTVEQEEQIEKLVRVVGKAREQKHGTMVVITEEETAENELITLKKQSTLIEPIEINTNYIKYLTSIDGAVYFDKSSVCHAIGVILDGLANVSVGDASRGARYNSAHRYFHKLKEDKKKCVIAIVSEDGMVDLIPEESEEKLYLLVREIIDLISKHKQEDNEELLRMENELKLIDNIDCDLYFKIADKFYDNAIYNKALFYYEKGFFQARNIFVVSPYYFRMGYCYHINKDNDSMLNAVECYQAIIDRNENDRLMFLAYYNVGLAYGGIFKFPVSDEEKETSKEILSKIVHSFTRYIEFEVDRNIKDEDGFLNSLVWRAWGYNMMTQSNLKTKDDSKYINKSIDDYTTYLNIKEEGRIYRSRSSRYEALGMIEESIRDLINAETLESDKRNLVKLQNLFEENSDFFVIAIQHFNIIRTETRDSSELRALLESMPQNEIANNQEVAPTEE